jgi:hypothetical protein
MISIILVLFTLLVIKHFIADFLLQTDTMVKEKGTYRASGGVYHSLIHAIFTFSIVAGMFSVPLGIFASAIDFIVHYHVDWAKMNISRNLTPANKEFWIWLGVDQLLHYLTYIGIVYVIIS